MADYRSDWLSFEAALDAAFLTASLPRLHERVIIDPHATSAVRVLGKSMYVLAGGWIAAVAWLWLATVRQHLLRGVPTDSYLLEALLGGLAPALVMTLIGAGIERWAGRAPNRWLRRREWVHAFWWALVPNALLFVTVWVMIQEGR
jgi:hypothetical protein